MAPSLNMSFLTSHSPSARCHHFYLKHKCRLQPTATASSGTTWGMPLPSLHRLPNWTLLCFHPHSILNRSQSGPFNTQITSLRCLKPSRGSPFTKSKALGVSSHALETLPHSFSSGIGLPSALAAGVPATHLIVLSGAIPLMRRLLLQQWACCSVCSLPPSERPSQFHTSAISPPLHLGSNVPLSDVIPDHLWKVTLGLHTPSSPAFWLSLPLHTPAWGCPSPQG